MNAEIKKRMHELAERIAERAGVSVEEVMLRYRRACRGVAVNAAMLLIGRV